MSDLYRAIGRSMMSRYAVYAFNLLSLVVLTHIFTPKTLGVVAAAQTIVVLFQLVAEGGLSPAIINLSQLCPRDRNGIFGLSFLAAAVVCVIMFLLGPTVAQFYKMSDISRITPFVAIALFANTVVVLPLALLQRQQLFKRMAQAGVVAELAALVVTFVMHFNIPPLYAYAVYFPVKAVFYFSLNWYFSGETEFGRPVPGSRLSAISPLFRTTGHQLGFNFVNYFSRNLDNVLVGKFMGPSSLGVYDRAYQLMRYPLMLLTFAMTPAIQPVLRDTTHDTETVSRLHRDLAFKLSIVGSLAAVSMFFLAKYVVLMAFGRQWLTVIPIIKLLALIIPVQTILSASGSFFQAFNRVDLLFTTGLLWTSINVSAIAWGIYQGTLEALCWSLFVSFHINFFQIYYVMHRHVFHGGYLRFLASVWPFALTTAILASIAITEF